MFAPSRRSLRGKQQFYTPQTIRLKKQKPPWFAAADCCKIERKAIYIYSPKRLLYIRYTRKTKSISESDLLLFLTRKNTH